MKKLFFLFSLMLVLMFLSCAKNSNQTKKWVNFDYSLKNMERNYNLNGKVKSILENTYGASNENNEIEKIALLSKRIYSFDENQNLIVETEIDSTEEKVVKLVKNYLYDNNSNLTQMQVAWYRYNLYFKDSVVASFDTIFYKYDDKERLVEAKERNINNNYILKTYEYQDDYIVQLINDGRENIPKNSARKKYDSFGRVISDEIWKDDKFFLDTRYNYNFSGDLKQVTAFRFGEIIETLKFVYDKHGNRVNMKFSKPGKPLIEAIYEYEYDKTDNWVKQLMFHKNRNSDIVTNAFRKKKLSLIKEREIVYY